MKVLQQPFSSAVCGKTQVWNQTGTEHEIKIFFKKKIISYMKKAIVFQPKSKFIATFLLLPHFSYKYLPEIQKLSRHFPNFQFILFEEKYLLYLERNIFFRGKREMARRKQAD